MSRATILVAEPGFGETALSVLEEAGDVVPWSSHDAFVARLPEADAVVTALEVRLDAELLERAERLRVIASRTSQLRHVDLEVTRRRGIDVLYIDPNDPVLQETTSTAEEAWALLLALARNVPWAFDSLKAGRWERRRYGGHELRGKTLGLVGFGRLGRMVARYGTAFEMRVLAHDPYVAEDEMREHGVEPVSLEALLRDADAISIHCTYSTETEGLVGERELATVKPGALLVNTARGEITDEGAVLAALEDGRLGGAAIDTLAGERADGGHLAGNPLVEYARTHENLIVVPHLGGATIEATERTQVYISRKLVDHLRTR